MLFSLQDFDDHEEVIFFYDREAALKGIIAIHNSTLGPALGGVRARYYGKEEEAISDVLRLSRAMSYKAAMADLHYGGGKSVIIKAQETAPLTDRQLRAFARQLEKLNGRYIAAEDVGTTQAHMDKLRQWTKHIAGYSSEDGGSGDPSFATAYGVKTAMRAAISYRMGRESFKDLAIAVQGLGNVGYKLCELLVKEGAIIVGADPNKAQAEKAKQQLGIQLVAPEDIYKQEVAIFAPCAMGAVLNQKIIPKLKAKMIVGSANNQLAREEDAELLLEWGILYAPDYIVNAGGLIHVSYEGKHYDRLKAFQHIDSIFDRLISIFKEAEKKVISPAEVADLMAKRKIQREKKKI